MMKGIHCNEGEEIQNFTELSACWKEDNLIYSYLTYKAESTRPATNHISQSLNFLEDMVFHSEDSAG